MRFRDSKSTVRSGGLRRIDRRPRNDRSASRARRGSRAAPHPSGAIPRDWAWLSPRDVWIVLAGIGALIAAMWVRHGGLSRDPLTIVGEVSALAGTYAALIGVLFMSRAPWLDQVFGADALRGSPLDRLHRVYGVCWPTRSLRRSPTPQVRSRASCPRCSISSRPCRACSAPSSRSGSSGWSRSPRSRPRAVGSRYESWHGIHLYIYLAMAFGFLHQLTIGADFVDDQDRGRVLDRALPGGLPAVAAAPDRVADLDHAAATPRAWPRSSPSRRACSASTSAAATWTDGGPLRPILRGPRAHAERLDARPSVQRLRRAERQLAPLHDQGVRRRDAGPACAPGRDTAPARGSVRCDAWSATNRRRL